MINKDLSMILLDMRILRNAVLIEKTLLAE